VPIGAQGRRTEGSGGRGRAASKAKLLGQSSRGAKNRGMWCVGETAAIRAGVAAERGLEQTRRPVASGWIGAFSDPWDEQLRRETARRAESDSGGWRLECWIGIVGGLAKSSAGDEATLKSWN